MRTHIWSIHNLDNESIEVPKMGVITIHGRANVRLFKHFIKLYNVPSGQITSVRDRNGVKTYKAIYFMKIMTASFEDISSPYKSYDTVK